MSIRSSVNVFLIFFIVIGIEIDGEERWDGMGWDGMGWDGRELTWAVPAHNADT